ncbi:hypothetical protein CKAH01_00525 [Colletotrichum kahawae]|uniref:Uncharacterized protein n=1 Tax=Colletotrichum kahawae TaxID=34407 RepID=A0AAD9YJ72_COLKA|nr:hypothetical protein CKAH01_00525 [Colletotrichum kahawae]
MKYVPPGRLKRLPLRDRDLGEEGNASTNGQRDAGRGGKGNGCAAALARLQGTCWHRILQCMFCCELHLTCYLDCPVAEFAFLSEGEAGREGELCGRECERGANCSPHQSSSEPGTMHAARHAARYGQGRL